MRDTGASPTSAITKEVTSDPVIAEWHGLKMSAGQITRLKAGDVITLDPGVAAQVQLRLSEIAKFTGRPGTCGGKWAVQLTSAIVS